MKNLSFTHFDGIYYYNRPVSGSSQNISLLNSLLNEFEGRAKELVSICGNRDWV